MLTLVLIVLLLLFSITALLAAWTLWFQGYIYSEPVQQIYWRAPAAGGAVVLFLLLWMWIDYSLPGRIRGLHEFSSSQDQEPYKELIIETNDGREETYKREKRGGQNVYLRNGKEIPSRPKNVIAVLESGEKIMFEPERDPQGNYKAGPGEALRYVNKEKRLVLVEGEWAQGTTFRWWWFIQNLFVNLVHFAVWWAVLWLLLEFQFWHAFGQAVVIWLAMTLFVVPPLLDRVEELASQRAVSTKSG